MMFAELAGFEGNFAPSDGFAYIVETFSCPVYTVLYLIWIVAIWFHLSHGFWSALHTFGWNGKVWMCRWKVIGTVYVTIIMLMFAVVALAFAFGIAPSLQEACCPGCPGVPGAPAGGSCF
jgi:succinate dehydrogenase / fumarate reductase cytochrome b subunit